MIDWRHYTLVHTYATTARIIPNYSLINNVHVAFMNRKKVKEGQRRALFFLLYLALFGHSISLASRVDMISYPLLRVS